MIYSDDNIYTALEKVAGYTDLNELSVDEFIDFAAGVEAEMEKEAFIRSGARRIGHAVSSPFMKRKKAKMLKKLKDKGFMRTGEEQLDYTRLKAGRDTPKLSEGMAEALGYGTVAAPIGIGAGAYAYSKRRKKKR